MYIFPFIRTRYIKTITINTHIDCSDNSKYSVRDILLATKQGAFESVFGTFSVILLEAIQCSDPGLQAAMASIKTDNGPEGMRNNFEATAAHLLPYDPVAKKRSNGQKRGSAQISSVMDPTPTTTKKPSIGKTGVHLRYYKTGEYRNLTNEQKEELKEWRANNPNTFKAGSKKAKKEAPKKSKSSMKKQVASLVEAALNKSVKFDDLKSKE